ncbi:MAG: class I SAM-dependent methyltransferase [Methylocystis sp.]|uniref:class I SAM-dependent methyltransferase n=1 Tax=Methylocystis sp. TaxID=1911079 RepID=UPI003D0E66FC
MTPSATPLCPITGRPAVRLVQTVPTRLLGRLWKIEFGADAWPSFGAVEQFGLWESPTGLLFFDPPVEGDHGFYEGFYSRLKKLGLYSNRFVRPEFNLAARHVPPGARVLDVGCGPGNFRHCVPHADYTGLDPHFGADSGDPSLRNETLGEHLLANAASYDAVCAFQVLEHLSAPASLFSDMLRAAKPGGLVFIGVPHTPSALTRIPNFLMNAPPHHLSWWTIGALAEMANRAGAIVESVEKVPWGEDDALLYWISRCSPMKCDGDAYYGEAPSWHASAALGLLGGLAARLALGVPAQEDEGTGLLLVARRPAGKVK